VWAQRLAEPNDAESGSLPYPRMLELSI